jgi:hypothetical protein
MGIAECATFMGADEIIWADVPVICSCAELNFESRMCSGVVIPGGLRSASSQSIIFWESRHD